MLVESCGRSENSCSIRSALGCRRSSNLMNLTGVGGESNAAMADELSMSEMPKGLESECMRDIRVAEPRGIGERFCIFKADFILHVADVIVIIRCEDRKGTVR